MFLSDALRDGENIVGRGRGVDVRIDPDQSRRHVRISIDADGALDDLGRKNGTTLAGESLRRARARSWSGA